MKKTKKPIALKIFSVFALLTLISVASLFGLYIYTEKNIDFEMDEALFAQSRSGNITRFYYNSSKNGGYIPAELSSIEPIGNKRTWYSYDELGESLKSAFVAAEDRRFYEHNGVDKKRTAFAVLNYFLHIKPKFGGSSITQQMIKNISGDNESTPKRKIAEIIRATHIENSHSKEEIFEVYMNVIPMGEKISGVGLAALTYFGKEPTKLSIPEAATLVGIANAPSKYNPYTNPKACISKRNNVLYAMLDCDYISKEEYSKFVDEELNIVPRQSLESDIYSWFVETVCDDVVKDLMAEKNISESAARLLILNGGLSIHTTQNPQIQNILEQYFENLSFFPSNVENGLDYSMVITDSRTGDLLALVGSVGKKSANRILNNALTLHPPGSALKPIALYAPILESKKANWATVFDDVPVTFTKQENGDCLFYPQNSPKRYDGLITMSNALRLSKNTIAVRLYNIIGKNNIYDNLKNNYGFEGLIRSKKLKNGQTVTDLDVSPLALGQLSYGVTLRKLTEAYTVFPAEGIYRGGRSYVAVYDSQGKILLENKKCEMELLTAETARIMNQMLSLVTESGTASEVSLKHIVDTAGKTGTSGDDKNRFFIGYTPYFTAGIRCGYNDNKSIGKQDVSHLKIWDAVMTEVHEMYLEKSEEMLSFSTENLEYLPYCMDSGKLYSTECMNDLRGCRLEYGYFTADNKPHQICDRHIMCFYDKLSGKILFNSFNDEMTVPISLLKNNGRNFQCDVFVADTQYMLDEEIDIEKDGFLGAFYEKNKKFKLLTG